MRSQAEIKEIEHELIHGKGWVILDSDHPEKLEELKSVIFGAIQGFPGLSHLQSIDEFREHLKSMPESEINTLKLYLLKVQGLSFLLQEAFQETTEGLVGKEFFLQRRPHVMFNIPGIKNTSVMHHIEAMSGISPFTYVLWAPIHDILDNSGIYVVDQKRSMELMNESRAQGEVMGDSVLNFKCDPVRMRFGQGAIFNPYVIHGSVEAAGPLARIGVTNRFQSVAKPLFLRNSDFFYPCSFHR